MTLGSLFDGIGGFPYIAKELGIEPVWASEIEPFPVNVTKYHFPNMQHLGDICKINGADIETVDIITGGSPCQDFSVAGKRAGLEGDRSVLFMKQIRIIKEMRNATNDTYPRYCVWENVPGVFSSDKGKDFQKILEEFCKISDETITIPMPYEGKWNTAGCIMGNGFSIAWRVFDAQYWGVPQRRRRIYLVADFRGYTAPEILFKCQSMSGYSQESGESRERIAAGTERSIGKAISFINDITIKIDEDNTAFSLRQRDFKDPQCICIQGNSIDRADTAGCNGKGWTEDVCYTLNTIDRPAVMAYGADLSQKAEGICFKKDIATCVNTGTHGGHGNHVVTYQKCTGPLMANSHPGSYSGQDAYTDMFVTQQMHDQQAVMVAGIDCRNAKENGNLCGTLQSKPSGGYSYNCLHPVRIDNIVRRLTPLECERLQGFPDNWTNIEKASDSARYKALGNSVAIPCVRFVLSRIKELIK